MRCAVSCCLRAASTHSGDPFSVEQHDIHLHVRPAGSVETSATGDAPRRGRRSPAAIRARLRNPAETLAAAEWWHDCCVTAVGTGAGVGVHPQLQDIADAGDVVEGRGKLGGSGQSGSATWILAPLAHSSRPHRRVLREDHGHRKGAAAALDPRCRRFAIH